MIHIGVIGYGYWGPNLVRNFSELPPAKVVAVADFLPSRLELVKTRYPLVHTTTNTRELISDTRIDAIVIATPVSSHFDLAMEALRAGKHVLVEKPLAASSHEALQLIEEANRRNLVLMVDHTFVYTDAVRCIKKLVDEGQLGQIYYYDSVRVNLGIFQPDVNVLWDLAVHDLSIMDYVLSSKPSAVTATGISHTPSEVENIAYLTCFFESNMIAHMHANWLAPVKIRSTLIGGDRRMIVYNDLEHSEKIKVYDRGITSQNHPSTYELMVGYRMGDMWAPKLDLTEALRYETLHFIQCIEEGIRPITDGEAGLRVIRILEAASESIRHRGRLVEINDQPSRTPLTPPARKVSV